MILYDPFILCYFVHVAKVRGQTFSAQSYQPHAAMSGQKPTKDDDVEIVTPMFRQPAPCLNIVTQHLIHRSNRF